MLVLDLHPGLCSHCGCCSCFIRLASLRIIGSTGARFTLGSVSVGAGVGVGVRDRVGDR